MRILLTFIGKKDTAFQEDDFGPILSILKKMNFDKAYFLYNNEAYLRESSKFVRHCRNQYPAMKIELKESAAQNPTDYNIVYPAMYKTIKEIIQKNQKAKFSISITSGTPTMHACWIFLQQGGVIDAKLFQVSRESGISNVNFNLDDFPKIKNVNEVKAHLTKLSRENENLKKQLHLKYDPIIGESPAIIKIKEQIQILSQYDISVLVLGESGTGKELVAEAIHYNSGRKENSFVRVNCGAISPQLFESEFFGHKKGSFTGAISDKDGKFTTANQGTVFLDEIADLPKDMQVKLLRILNDGTLVPVGGNTEIKVNVRIIAATNRNIKKLVESGEFREDLYFRIAGDIIDLPSLRNRGNDSIILTNDFLKKLNIKYKSKKFLDKSVIETIENYNWKGNIRQLKAVLERAFIYAGKRITCENLNIEEKQNENRNVHIPNEGIDLESEVLNVYYKEALKRTKGNASKAAALLRMAPHTFRARLKSSGIEIKDVK
jgi:transcriptional regulator with PAS, ATPase and Fis domain